MHKTLLAVLVLLLFAGVASAQEQHRTLDLILLDATVNGRPVVLLLDTGSNHTMAGFDILTANNTLHRWQMGNNGAALDPVVGAATVDTFTNKNYNAQGTGNNFQIGGQCKTRPTYRVFPLLEQIGAK